MLGVRIVCNMKAAAAVIFLFLFCYVECRKIVPPIDKNVNTAFINMEVGSHGAAKPKQVVPTPAPKLQPVQPTVKPLVPSSPVQPTLAKQTPEPAKPAAVPAKPTAVPAKPAAPSKPAVNPLPAAKPSVTTPGPGSVKQLVNFYDSQGKHSVIRPYSYSQAVKQG